ncbi:unnamed protein product, partial [Mesorhabditis spiculigera]
MLKFLFILIPLAVICSASCPHMMGQAEAKARAEKTKQSIEARLQQKEEIGAPPGVEPKNDGSPGTVPEETSIQTTLIHLSKSDAEKQYAGLIAAKLREIRESLRKELRLTIDNEHISCKNNADDHFRCRDYSQSHSYHYLVVEDSSRGAAVYSLDRDLNGDSPGKVEAALLDALSRHTRHHLSLHASKEAEKEVGFVRELSIVELEHVGKTAKKIRSPKTYPIAPTEMQAIETQILEIRNSEGLDTTEHRLTVVPSEEVFNQMLQRYKYVFILFWTNVRSSSSHAYNQFAKLSNNFEKTEHIQLAVVNCHEVDFCVGLDYKDFYTVVAYQDGEKVATQSLVFDADFYVGWIERILAGTLVELKNKDELKEAKKGKLLGKQRQSVIIGVFPDKDAIEYAHYEKVAELLKGRYYMAYYLDKEAQSTLATYRPGEKKKRVDYAGAFDPPTLANFITYSPLPTVVDITRGFNPDLLFKQPLPIVLLYSPPSFDSKNFEAAAAKPAFAHLKYIFVRVNSDGLALRHELLKPLGISKEDEPVVILYIKNKAWHLELTPENDADEILKWVDEVEATPAEYTVTFNDAHPLMYLQIEASNNIFGVQPVQPLPDLSVFQIKAIKPLLNDMAKSGSGGGCPFMHGGAIPPQQEDARHQEL